jgi:hypothetical protein
MPIYEYECSACRMRFDLLRRMSEADDPTFCPRCTDGQVRRRVAGGHFELKGGGWYKDGYQK